jgi:hypothetical protein
MFAARCRATSIDGPTPRRLAQARTAVMSAFPPLIRAKRTSGFPFRGDWRTHSLILWPILHHGTIALGHFPRYELRCSVHVARESANRKSRPREADHAYPQHDDRRDSCGAFCCGCRRAGLSATHSAERGSHRKVHRTGSPAMAGRGSRGASATRRVLQGLHDGGWPESMSRIGAG